MDVRNCPKCGKMFTKVSAPICPACEKKEEEVFRMVKDYIDENPACTMGELSEATKVSAKKVLGYIREGRLEISKGMEGDVSCDSCGKPIKRGRYCDKCVIKINHQVGDLFSAKPEAQRGHISKTR